MYQTSPPRSITGGGVRPQYKKKKYINEGKKENVNAIMSEFYNMPFQDALNKFCEYEYIENTEKKWNITISPDEFTSHLRKYLNYEDEEFNSWHFTQYIGLVLLDNSIKNLISKYQHTTDKDLSNLFKIRRSNEDREPWAYSAYDDYWYDVIFKPYYRCDNYEQAEQRLKEFIDGPYDFKNDKFIKYKK